MATPLSRVRAYLNATLGTADGVLISETAAGNSKIVLAALRETTSQIQTIGIRSDTLPCFIVKVTIIGPNSNKILISKDRSTWTNTLFFYSVSNVNQLLYAKTFVDANEDYGDYLLNYLKIEFYAQV